MRKLCRILAISVLALMSVVMVTRLISSPTRADGGQVTASQAGGWQCWDDGALDPCHRTLQKIQALSEDDVWIVAGGPYHAAGILHNDGFGWQAIDPPPRGLAFDAPMAIEMISSSEGWIVGYGDPWHWNGTSWQVTPLGDSTGALEAVDVVAPDDVWAVGAGTVAHWNGAAWSTEAVSYDLKDVAMLSSDHGWAVGEGGSVVEWDGTSWISRTSPVTVTLECVAGVPGATGEAWAVGASGTILHYDGGQWHHVSSPTGEHLFSVAIASSTAGWAVGTEGGIVRYDGSGWRGVSGPTDEDLVSVSAASAESVYAISGEGGLFHWDGAAWQTLFASPDRRALNDVTMISATDGWAAGDEGRLAHWDGATWDTASAPGAAGSEKISELDFLGPHAGWAVGDGGLILRYDGHQWLTATTPTEDDLSGLDVISPTQGWAVGADGLILHYDGEAWETASSPTEIDLKAVAMASAEEGWAVGGHWDRGFKDVVLHWDGTAWSQVDTGLEGDIYFDLSVLGPDHVVALGIWKLARWDGSSWRAVDHRVSQGESLGMLDRGEGWAGGATGAISHWDGLTWAAVHNRLEKVEEIDPVANHEAWAVSSHGALLRYTAPEPVSGAATPQDPLVQTYPGHLTRVETAQSPSAAAGGAEEASQTLTLTYKLRPNDQGRWIGVDHFFGIAAADDAASAPLSVTARFSGTEPAGAFPGSVGLYRLGSEGWVREGITTTVAETGRVEALVTEPGSFGVLWRRAWTLYLPLVSRQLP